LRRKIKRLALEGDFSKLPRCIVGMEACLSAHFVSRRLRALGFEPRIIPGIYVKPFVNDHRLKAGGFLLRLKAGLVRHSADWVPQTNLVL